MSQVFISYSHAEPDGRIALHLQAQIEANGFEVWSDSKIRLGQDWVQQIDLQLRPSAYLVALLSPTSIKSDMVRREIAIAYSLKKAGKIAILPIRLGLDEELPYELGAYLGHLQHIAWQRGQDLELMTRAVLEALGGKALTDRTPTAAVTINPDPKRFTGPEYEAITMQVARFLGPVARVLVAEAASKAKSWVDLYALLALEIPAGEERRKFEAATPRVR